MPSVGNVDAMNSGLMCLRREVAIIAFMFISHSNFVLAPGLGGRCWSIPGFVNDFGSWDSRFDTRFLVLGRMVLEYIYLNIIL